ncbi:MAG: dihydroorotate dehydrogenase-like protein [Armatimonadota bacterium]|nr:dihydroorotate dehydrogenase-like protein [bacterium]MDW8320191.1 dihydroorotate dehydrogenase-like protein [Armatimonadota bacterium]
MSIDFSTTYMGLKLRNPLVASSSPLSHKIDTICKLEEAGIGAVVMYSLFEEQITLESQQLDYFLTHGTESYAEALSYFPDIGEYNVGPDEYLSLIRKAKETVNIPVIGSLNGVSAGGWVKYARLIEQAGADALELNVYYLPTDPNMPGTEVEQMTVDVVKAVRSEVSVPLAVKIGPFFSSIPNVARRLVDAGANALVLFNRFYQPDIDIENLEVVPHLVLRDSDELRLPLRWTAILYGRVSADLAITTGVHTYRDVLKGLMAGAKVTMMASELLQNGLGRIRQILQEIESWMVEYEYSSVQQMIGSMSQRKVAEPAAFERANYMKVLDSYPRLI